MRDRTRRQEKYDEDPYGRWWPRDDLDGGWSYQTVLENKHLYGDEGPYPWEEDWPYMSKRPRCACKGCHRPIIILPDGTPGKRCKRHCTDEERIKIGAKPRNKSAYGLYASNTKVDI